MYIKSHFKKLSDENKGFIFGFVGIIIFSITPVATKIALAHCIERHACHIVGGHAVQQIQAIPPLRPQPAHGSTLKQDAPSVHGCI